MTAIPDIIPDLIPDLMGDGAPLWTPRALGSRLRLWLNADLGITLNGNNVSAWADQSGQGHDFSQGTPAAQPPYIGITLSSGKQALDFDGANHWLAGTVTVAETHYSVFIVVKSDLTSGTHVMFDSQTGRVAMANPHLAKYGVFSTGPGWGDSGANDTNLHSLIFQLDSATASDLFVDGVSAGTYAFGEIAMGALSVIGGDYTGAQLFNGRIREVGIVAGPPLTAAERAAMVAYHRINSGTP